MSRWNYAAIVIFFGLTAAITWFFFFPLFLDLIVPAWIVLFAVVLLALMTVFSLWVRRIPRSARKKGILHGVLFGFLPGLAVLAVAWRGGQLPDALRFLPIMLLGVTVVLFPFFGLAWHVGTLILARIGLDKVEPTQHPGKAARWLAAVVAAILFLFCLGPWAWSLVALDQARGTSMKSRSRGIWTAILSCSMEREEKGLPALWPRELGFTGSERSTDYFRRLLSDEAGIITEDADKRLVSDLGPEILAGPGLREAASAAAFAAENNAWQVVCIGSNAPSWAPFLISRNVDFGEWLTPTSQPRFIRSGPLNLRRVVWVTRGGGIFDARFKTFRSEMLFDSWGGDQDAAATSMAYRIMRP